MFTHFSAMKTFIKSSALGVARSLAHVTYALPLLVQGLLPQGNLQEIVRNRKSQSADHLVIATTDSKDIAGHRPADMPDDILKGVQDPKREVEDHISWWWTLGQCTAVDRHKLRDKLRIQNDFSALTWESRPLHPSESR